MNNKEAIALLKKATLFEPKLENKDYPEALDLAIKALEEQPKGKWIYEKPNGKKYSVFVYCSECQKPNGFYTTNFCPNCGVRME